MWKGRCHDDQRNVQRDVHAFFCDFAAGTAAWPQTAQSSILPSASLVTASIWGSNASQFGTLLLTAYAPVISWTWPQPPLGGELPPGAPIRVGGPPRKTTTYVVSGTSNGGSQPLSINQGGYLEVSVIPNPVVNGSDGSPIRFPPGNLPWSPNNRFTASVVINGTDASGANWSSNPIQISLVLNAVQISGTVGWNSSLPSSLIKVPMGGNQNFLAGEGSIGILWAGEASLWPADPADYPIRHTLASPGFGPEPGLGEIVPSELWMAPADLIATWNPQDVPSGALHDDRWPTTFLFGNIPASVIAAPAAQTTPRTPFPSLMQYFLGSSWNRVGGFGA
jgi:hypothetical protein